MVGRVSSVKRKRILSNKPLSHYIGNDPSEVARTAKAMLKGNIPYEDVRSKFIGLEIEIEHCVGEYRQTLEEFPRVFIEHADGSLRNGGVEFVSYPFNLEYTRSILDRFLTSLTKNEPGAKFTNRCSIHIHQDVTDLSCWQFKCLFKLYLIFENAFYRYAGLHRKISNFCVPVADADFEDYFPSSVNTWGKQLESLPKLDDGKYSGLNLSRTREIGTVEWRHLPGTWDVGYIVNFITCIDSLKQFVLQQINPDFIDNLIKTANTVSNYMDICTRIFGENNKNILFPGGDFESIEEGVTTAKRLFFDRTDTYKPITFAKIISTPTLIETISKVMEHSQERLI